MSALLFVLGAYAFGGLVYMGVQIRELFRDGGELDRRRAAGGETTSE